MSGPGHAHHRLIAAFLCGSGMCALIYQVAWLRELRLVFGASTPASAAVLAVFMGGLGWGSAWLSKRAERAPRPLAMYAHLELGIAASAALTPLMLWAVRAGYVALGGTTALGMFGGTIVRLLASALVLLPPTFLMGGTLPAAARAAESEDDTGRSRTALLYGANTLGAVAGAALTTFLLLEVFGTQLSLWLGCAVNALVAVLARVQARRLPELPVAPAEVALGDKPPRFALVAAGAVGFVFLLLELVWYRMLAPLLGGSTYTFGLILAVALLGVGAGGLLYTLRGDRQPTLTAFAGSCALEALLIALPFAFGDRLAVATLMMRSFGSVGLWGHAVAWTVVAGLVVLPGAIVAGYQFPLLIALSGRGRAGVGRHVGLLYAFNTLGAIAGSLAGGFLLMPLLGAPGAWQLCVAALALLGAAALILAREPLLRSVWPAGLVLASLVCVALPEGPTAVWRHSPIGTGRADHVIQSATRNDLRRWMREQRYAIIWQADGRESSVALHALRDMAFVVNGKSDGSTLVDATTQVMSGMLGALMHPDVKRAMVIGLGTGSTAGWLAEIPGIDTVDVVEIEPAIVHVARMCAPVNRNALDNPKLVLHDGDAREVLLTTPHRYDLVFSEPSNPYRAGIASLFTHEFYRAVKERLTEGGVFVQWVQGYEVDVHSVGTVYATLLSVFGTVTSWRTDTHDLILVASDREMPLDVAVLRERIRSEPYRSALMAAWRVNSVEGVLAYFVAAPGFARLVADQLGAHAVNVDDRNQLEFGVARALGRRTGFSIEGLRRAAGARGFGRPALTGGEVRWERVTDARMTMSMAHDGHPAPVDPHELEGPAQFRYQALQAWARDDPRAVLELWARAEQPVREPLMLMVIADALAATGHAEELAPVLDKLRGVMPTEALAVEARLAHALGDGDATLRALTAALTAYRSDPWPSNELMLRVLDIAPKLAAAHPEHVAAIVALLEQPFVVNALRWFRERHLVTVALMHDDPAVCVAALARFEPDVPWEIDILSDRVRCYERAGHPSLGRARAELDSYLEDAPQTIEGGLVPP